jgi:hypothetical protein
MEEAKALIVLTCPLSGDGKGYYARELAEDQTLENLQLFSDKLEKGHKLLVKAGICECSE